MLVTKQRNSLSTRNIDLLMRIVLLSPDDFSDPTWVNCKLRDDPMS